MALCESQPRRFCCMIGNMAEPIRANDNEPSATAGDSLRAIAIRPDLHPGLAQWLRDHAAPFDAIDSTVMTAGTDRDG